MGAKRFSLCPKSSPALHYTYLPTGRSFFRLSSSKKDTVAIGAKMKGGFFYRNLKENSVPPKRIYY
ncbi:hypothetical protein OA86_09010 [Kaistella jeonii]|uniref:Uncharacterized protein n=1 Tax=Kaistella jeonii TaxID=266749 RepID=A0A0C1FA59_9FLAO|nr:hypothetical protein OA86_09010 [Kaistella jeonii]